MVAISLAGVLAGGIFVLGGIFALTAMLQVWFLVELRRLEPRAWRVVASTGWLEALSAEAVTFLRERRYLQLRSTKLRRWGGVLRALHVLVVFLFAAYAACFVAALWLAAQQSR